LAADTIARFFRASETVSPRARRSPKRRPRGLTVLVLADDLLAAQKAVGKSPHKSP
jgi:hypothetical protein